jgi:hypothetical protein
MPAGVGIGAAGVALQVDGGHVGFLGVVVVALRVESAGGNFEYVTTGTAQPAFPVAQSTAD